MKPRIGILSSLIVLAVLWAAGGRSAHGQKIFVGSYTQEGGEDLYKGICQGCHMPDGKGATGAGAYPALANNVRLLSGLYPIGVVLNGRRAMPPFGADLSDAQIAAVINYVRAHFGNHYRDSVSAAAVKAARGAAANP
jgi:mono/diheme cytochrome c family protein